jgi:dipeptidyl aminopeptidase/acylaminoacyl peptidase
MKTLKKFTLVPVIILLLICTTADSQALLNTPNVESKLYTGDPSVNKPLIVGFGGSEGGNAWASNYWKNIREEFLKRGYAFLAVGYFKAKGTPDTLNKIPIDQVHAAIAEAAKNPQVNKKKIAIIGGSRGGDLALLIASFYKDIRCVVAIVPSNAVFPGNTNEFATSAWTYKGKELPFVPVSEEAVPALVKHDLRSAFEIMLKDSLAFKKAVIRVERINGPVLLLSADKDEVCPSSPMCESMITRFRLKKFRFYYEHMVIDGPHSAPLKHFDKVFDFLEKNFK